MFIEKGPGYKGKRLYLQRLREEDDMDKIKAMRRTDKGGDADKAKLVYFKVIGARPLVGNNDE